MRGQRYQEAEDYRRKLRRNLDQALAVWGEARPEERRFILAGINELNEIKNRIEARARDLGFSRACQESRTVCRGECCRKHFPENLSPVDLLVSVAPMSREARRTLRDHLAGAGRISGCPLLLPDGCFFSFEHRPFVCTVAYPCHITREYWLFKEQEREKVRPILAGINLLFPPAAL